MKNVIFLVVGLAVGFVAGVFTGRCGAGASNATAKAEAVDDVFSGEAKDGELVEVGEYGKFRLNPKQKEIVEKKNVIVKFDNSLDRTLITKLKMDNPWLLDDRIAMEVEESYKKMVMALLESRKKAQANN